MHDIAIRNGMVIDGTGAAPVRLDVTVDGMKISGLHKDLDSKAAVDIDASGLVVCPGFIDIHTHSDLHLLSNPLAESKIRQGVTTELVGNCGGSAAPLLGKAKADLEEQASMLDVSIDWVTVDEYLLRLQNLRTSVNVATLVGAETLRMAVIGPDNLAATPSQLDEMNGLLAEAMLDGAYGLSSGLIYAPGCYASTEELVSLASTASSLGGFYASHIRGEGSPLLSAVREAIRIGREAHVRVEISHHKACGPSNWGLVERSIRLIEEARREGVDVAFDVYPYTASSTSLDTILPPWAREGGREKVLERLARKDVRARIAGELASSDGSWDNVVADDGWDNIVVVGFRNAENAPYENMSLAKIAEMRGVEPSKAAFDLLVEEDLQLWAIFHEMSEEDVKRVISHPLACVGSDGEAEAPYGPMGEYTSHPRSYGTFPRAISRYALDLGLMPLEEVVRKMTSSPAQRIGLPDRGVLAKGMKADVVIFDPARIRDMATYDDSHRYPEGVRYVIVNGAITVEDGEHTKERAGQVLRHAPRVS
jgi:N-acyl-D-amino-acid deacylase